MQPYQRSNKVTSNGFTWLFLSSLLGGAAIGWITYFISLLIYLIILFPLVMGVAGGMVMSIAVRQGKVRSPMIAALFGVLTGISLYGSMHGAEYWQFKRLASEQISEELGLVESHQSNQLINTYLQEQTGSTGFLGFLKYSAQQGVSIGRFGSDGINLGETGTWIYWLIEFGAINVIIAAIAHASARTPFCENCDQWYGEKERVGSVNAQSSNSFLTLLQEDQWSRAGKLLDPLQGVYASSLEVHLQRCPSCSLSPLLLTVNTASRDNKGNLQLKEVAQGTVSLSQYNKFQESVTANLSQNPEKSADRNFEEIQLAQQERASISASDRLLPHGLSTAEEAELVQQIARYSPVKRAYLVRKDVRYFPEKPFYILGIIRRVGFIESEEAESRLLTKLTTELKLPNQTWIISLNKDKAMTQAMQQVAGQAIYQKK